MKKSFTAKLWKLMKVCAVQVVAAITFCGLVIAHPHYGQLLDRRVSVNLEAVPFERALHQLEDAASIKFAYSIDQLEDEPVVSLTAVNQTLRAILEELLPGRSIQYKVHESDGVITLRKSTPEGRRRQSFSRESALPQTFQVSGVVTESVNGLPMAGVNVVVKGTTNGTATDVQGRYIVAADRNDILVFSFIGFQPQEVSVAGRTSIDVSMVQDALSLGEVIVNAGYWTVKDRERTGNIGKIDAEEIRRQPVGNPLQALQGRMPGVYIQQNTGLPGGSFRVEIRGRNSLRGQGNDPLYVVDGIPFPNSSISSPVLSSTVQGGSPFAAINPSDIESIEILKDADATAIYGSRGANGVVLITTKKGKPGRTSVDVNVSRGFGRVSNYMDLLKTDDYVEMRREALTNDGFWPLPSFLEFIAPDLYVFDTTQYTDWQKKLIGGTAHTTNAQVSVSGGSGGTRFLLSSGYYNEGTVFPGEANFRRISGALSLNHSSPNGKYTASVSANYTSSLNRLFPSDLTREAVTLPPNMPQLRDSQRGINWNWNNPFYRNPLATMEKTYRTVTDNLMANIVNSYQFTKSINARLNLGYSSMTAREFSTDPLSSMPPAAVQSGATASSLFGDGFVKTWIAEPQVDYSKQFGGGELTVLLGASFQESVQQSQTLHATGYTNDALLENILASTDVTILDATHSQYRYAAIFSRINYNWKGKYIVNLTGRRDGSSRFGPGKRFGNFGAVGAAWIFSEELSLSEEKGPLSFGKLRASFGATGSDAIGNYQYLNTYSSTTYPYNGSPGLIVTRLANPDYSWETNRKFETGIDLGFFRDRLRFAASWFDNRSSDQLVGLPLPVITGQSTVQFNFPATVQNKGWELLLSTVNINNDRFKWETDVNVTFPKNVLLKFPDIDAFPAYDNLYRVGSSVFTKRALRQTGVDVETGLYTFEDLDEDGDVSISGDGAFDKEVAQQYFGGINNSFTYKGFRLDIFFQFVKQSGYNYLLSYQSPGNMSNQPRVVLDRWQKPGDVAPIQQFSLLGPGSGQYIYSQFSDRGISDASFVRLKNASLSWTLPSRWTAPANIGSCRAYVLAQNIFTITDYVGLDPETQNSTALPPLRVVTFGVQITFE